MRAFPLVLAALAGCGARTALEVDATALPRDGGVEVGPGSDRPGGCQRGTFPLDARAPRVLLVVDRSGSMALDLSGNAVRPRRWDVLRAELPRALRRFETDLEVGAVLFPVGAACGAPTRLDVAFARRNADAIAARLEADEPNGNTPTFAALVQAERILAGSSGEGARAVLLATDGGPNCNVELDGNACVCTAGSGGTGNDECRGDPRLCFDDRRAVAQVEAMATRGVTTFVVGLDGDRRPELVEVLDRLARAGGRPRAPAPARAYYPVRDPAALGAAVASVAATVSRCVLAAPLRPPEGTALTVRVGESTVPRDPARANGWEWSAPGRAEIALYGAACEAATAGANATLTLECR